MNDPFAPSSTPSDEDVPVEETAPEPEPAPAPKKKAAPKRAAPAPSLEERDGKWVITLKGGAGFEAPWLVGHLSSLQEVNDALSGPNAELLVDTFEKLQKASAKLQEFGPTKAAPPRGGGGGGQARQAPAGARQAPGGETRYCDHGQMIFRSGVSQKTGNPYQLFACPERDRSQQCKAQFLN